MKKRLSALTTPLWKFIFPAVFIAPLIINLVLNFGAVLGINVKSSVPFTWNNLWVYPVYLIICLIVYKVLGTLKRVFVDENYLYVSNYWKEIKIPLPDITHVDKPENSSHRRIKIFLRAPSEFGDVIIFMPGFFSANEVWEELQDWINNSIRARHNNSLDRSAK